MSRSAKRDGADLHRLGLAPCVPGGHDPGLTEIASAPTTYRRRALTVEGERRRDDAERKASGLPDPRELDRAIVDAIRDAPLTGARGPEGRTHPHGVHVEGLVRRAAHSLQRRGYLPAATVPVLFARISRDTLA